MNESGRKQSEAKQSFKAAKESIRRGDRVEARRLARKAINFMPEWEAPWILMGIASEPEQGLSFIARALEIDPTNEVAKKAIRWVMKRMPPKERGKSVQDLRIPEELKIQIMPIAALTQNRVLSIGLILPILLGVLGVGLWVGYQPVDAQQPQVASAPLQKATWTPTSTNTPTYTPTPTLTSTPTSTSTPTNTPTPTISPTPRPRVSFNYVLDPELLASEERWIDVDVTNQRVTAYEGSTPVKTFVVSTGTAYHPTVTGLFRIWLKLRWDDMAGPGYYLPSVPYTMYFYEGYALHGTYWHSNFGTPMSHGCVNLHTDDASWLFDFASVGMLVNVHPAVRMTPTPIVVELGARTTELR